MHTIELYYSDATPATAERVGGSLVISIVSFFLGSTNRRDGRIVIGRVESGSQFLRRPPPGRGNIIDV
ncbi:MAG: hypothetical protein K8T26_10840 [Lentisphaerae bacterium]|nr:hypothetical protein [Lentisphaerota bacterium]